jgi:hypothetical protein
VPPWESESIAAPPAVEAARCVAERRSREAHCSRAGTGYRRDMAIGKNKRGTALSINLPMEMAQAVYEKVRDGSFDSAGAVVREALRQMLKLADHDDPPSRARKEG